MPLDPRVRRFLDLLAATNPPSASSLTVAQRRTAVGHLMAFAGPPAAVARVDDGTVPGPGGAVPVRTYTPEGAPAGLLPGMVYFHGGGLVAGSLDTHDTIARSLAAATGCRTVSVGYRLSPEAPFPAALEDACAAVDYVAAHAAEFGIDPARLGVAGDSAGATLAAAACQRRAASGAPALRLQLLLCPILDYAGRSASRVELASGYLVDEATLEHDLRHYLAAGGAAEDPRVSPLRSPALGALPPALIHAAEYDPLRDEAAEYARRLTAAGGSARYTCHAGMIHLFYGLAGVIPYARSAWAQIGAEVHAALAGGA